MAGRGQFCSPHPALTPSHRAGGVAADEWCSSGSWTSCLRCRATLRSPRIPNSIAPLECEVPRQLLEPEGEPRPSCVWSGAVQCRDQEVVRVLDRRVQGDVYSVAIVASDVRGRRTVKSRSSFWNRRPRSTDAAAAGSARGVPPHVPGNTSVRPELTAADSHPPRTVGAAPGRLNEAMHSTADLDVDVVGADRRRPRLNNSPRPRRKPSADPPAAADSLSAERRQLVAHGTARLPIGPDGRHGKEYLMKHVSLGGLDASRIGLGAMTMAGIHATAGGLVLLPRLSRLSPLPIAGGQPPTCSPKPVRPAGSSPSFRCSEGIS
jgi:hypothetical protein